MFEKIISKNPGDDSSSSPPPVSPAPKPASKTDLSQVSKAPAPSGQRNVLLPDVEIKGKVRFENDLIVDGKIEGEITSDGSLTVGENARIKAEIKTRTVVVYGKVHGNITVTDRLELRANSEVIGDIRASVLAMDAGAIFVGNSHVGKPSIKDIPASGNKPETGGNKPAFGTKKPEQGQNRPGNNRPGNNRPGNHKPGGGPQQGGGADKSSGSKPGSIATTS